jgi:hypothetical protein
MFIQYDIYPARIGPKHANLQSVSDPMRPQDSKRIRMFSSHKPAQFIGRQSSDLE